MTTRSALIIGGGTGGLFTGAFLAREGWAVTVVEKNAIIGGGLQMFRRGNHRFETGMHTLGGFHEGGTLQRICAYLGIADRLRLRADDCLTEIHYGADGRTWHLPYGREALEACLAQAFPADAAGLHAYFDALYALTDEVEIFRLRESPDGLRPHSPRFLQPADEMIASFVADGHLRDILAYMNPMYAGVAGHTPAYIHALINALYIDGPCRFVGGSQQLADALSDVITDAGGEVIAGDAVARLDVEDRRITAVITTGGRRLTADTYISAIHPEAMLPLLPQGALPRAYCQRLHDIPKTYSAFTVYVGFRPQAFPYTDHTCYHQDDYGMVWTHGRRPDDDTWPRGFMYFTPPAVDQGPWAERMIINCVMPWEEVAPWADSRLGHRPEAYRRWKARRTQQVMDRMERLHPGFAAAADMVLASSPLTIRDYYATPQGALFGYRKDCHDFMLSYLPVATKVKNLLLTGQNINLHGICGVPLTAILTAEALTGRNTIIRKIRAAGGDGSSSCGMA